MIWQGKPLSTRVAPSASWRASETRLPEAMTDQDQPLPLLGFFGRKATSLHGLDAEE